MQNELVPILEQQDLDEEFIVDVLIREKLESFSELETAQYLANRGYDQQLLEEVNTHLSEDMLKYNLKHLYLLITKEDKQSFYSEPLQVIMKIVNAPSDEDRRDMVINELAQFHWVPRIKQFMNSFVNEETNRHYIEQSSSYTQTPYVLVYYPADSVGQLAFIADKWFLFKDDTIEKASIEQYCNDAKALNEIGFVQYALRNADIKDNQLTFNLKEGVSIQVLKENDEVKFKFNDKEITFEELKGAFEGAAIPFSLRNWLPILAATAEHFDMIVELDIGTIVCSKNKEECAWVIKYAGKGFVYEISKQKGNNFFVYDQVKKLVENIAKDYNYDLQGFFEEELNKEEITTSDQERQEKLENEIEVVDKQIAEIEKQDPKLLNEQVLSEFYNRLKVKREDLAEELMVIKKSLSYKQ